MGHQLVVEGFELRLEDEVVWFFVDREVLEDGEVEQAAAGLGGVVVGALVAIDQVEGFIEGGHDVIDLVSGGLGPLLDLCLLLGDAGLLGAQDVFGDGVAVVELDELLLLGGQFGQAAGVPCAFAAGDLGFVLDVLTNERPDVLAFVGGQPVNGVDGVELLFDEGEADVASPAGSIGRDAAEAGVVLVVSSRLTAVAAVAVAFAAGAADDLAGEVVVVFVAAAAAGAVAVEHRLDMVEGVLVDERLVAAAQLGVAVGDDADVVVVSEHPVHGRQIERLRGSLGRGARAQAGFVQELGDRADGVLPGGGQIEGHLDQRRALGIDGNAGDLAVLDCFADVEVAEAGRSDGAAFLVLALQPDFDLLSVVA